MRTFLGSSRIQLATSLLISLRLPSFGLTTTARSSDPSPLKSPTKKIGSAELADVATFSKTRTTASLISPLVGGAGLAATFEAAGVAAGCNAGCTESAVVGLAVVFACAGSGVLVACCSAVRLEHANSETPAKVID